MVAKSTRNARLRAQRSFDRAFRDDINGLVQERLCSSSLRESAAEKLSLSEVAFIHDEAFESVSFTELESARFEKDLFARPKVLADGAGIIDRMASTRLLTHHGEQFFFRRMNYLLYWAECFRSTLRPKRATAKAVARVEVLLKQAEQDRATVVAANLRLVLSLSRKFSNSDSEFEDLVSEGSVILVKAVDKFDYSRGFRFSTYATHAIQRHFFRRWKTNERRKHLVQLSPPELLAELVPVAEPEEDPLVDVAELTPIMRELTSQLDEREQHIVLERFGLGPTGVAQTLRSLAADLGISKERVRQVQLKALGKLQEIAAGLNRSSPLVVARR